MISSAPSPVSTTFEVGFSHQTGKQKERGRRGAQDRRFSVPDHIREYRTDAVVGAGGHAVLGLQAFDGQLLKVAFVEAPVAETHRKGAQPVVEMVFDQGAGVGAVDAAAQVGAHRHVGPAGGCAWHPGSAL